LEQQSRFADTRITANEYQGARDNAATEDAIEFNIARREACLGMVRNLR
jgi:hypothetical protein